MTAWEYQGMQFQYLGGLNLMVPCFHCGALVGVECQTASGRPVRPKYLNTHAARRELAYLDGWLPYQDGWEKLVSMGLVEA